MSLSYVRALRVLHHTYSSFPIASRAHILGRFLSCPFLRVLPHLPPNARVLDIGAGHGVFARLASEAGAREVVAVEPDLRKSLHPFRGPGVKFVAAFDEAIGGTFDAISMFDVLYRIPRAEWPSLFRRIRGRLGPGGVFLLKELDPGHRIKFAWNRAQEAISDRFFKLTIGEEFAYASREETKAELKAAGFERVEAIDISRGYPHSHILYLAR